jgi:hypothetical protein
MITNAQSGTNIHEIVDGIYRINTPVAMPGGCSCFACAEAVTQVMPIERLRYVTVSTLRLMSAGRSTNGLRQPVPRSIPNHCQHRFPPISQPCHLASPSFLNFDPGYSCSIERYWRLWYVCTMAL